MTLDAQERDNIIGGLEKKRGLVGGWGNHGVSRDDIATNMPGSSFACELWQRFCSQASTNWPMVPEVSVFNIKPTLPWLRRRRLSCVHLCRWCGIVAKDCTCGASTSVIVGAQRRPNSDDILCANPKQHLSLLVVVNRNMPKHDCMRHRLARTCVASSCVCKMPESE